MKCNKWPNFVQIGPLLPCSSKKVIKPFDNFFWAWRLVENKWRINVQHEKLGLTPICTCQPYTLTLRQHCRKIRKKYFFRPWAYRRTLYDVVIVCYLLFAIKHKFYKVFVSFCYMFRCCNVGHVDTSFFRTSNRYKHLVKACSWHQEDRCAFGP